MRMIKLRRRISRVLLLVPLLSCGIHGIANAAQSDSILHAQDSVSASFQPGIGTVGLQLAVGELS